jgi:hypothetical protein
MWSYDLLPFSSTLYNFERGSWLLCGAISGESLVFKHRLMTPDRGKIPQYDVNRLLQAVWHIHNNVQSRA